MDAFRAHFAEHRSHLAVCAIAAVLVFLGLAVTVPILVLVGALMCGAMMVGMVWMMISMSRHH